MSTAAPPTDFQAWTDDAPVSQKNETTRVLVADANATVRKLLRHNFQSMGWETLEADSGQEVLRRMGERPRPHAVLLDLAMPDGFDVCRSLKEDPQFRLTPVVMMTADESNAELMRAVEAGADEFLSKPINRAELTVRLRSLARMHRCNQELIGAESVALALARAVSSKDGYSSGHVEEVADTAAAFGEQLGLGPVEIKILRYGSILHNVGKIAIPDAILEKTQALTPRERALFQQHPRVGCDICAPLKPLKPVLPIIRHHKEHWDGTGFPDGLKGDAIPLGAQIVGIVDMYSALTNDRPFRKAKSHVEAVEHLKSRGKRGVFNRELVEKFIKFIDEQEAEKCSDAPANGQSAADSQPAAEDQAAEAPPA